MITAPQTRLRVVGLLTLAAAGCGTRFVDLLLAVDAGPDTGVAGAPAKCEVVTRADGSQCMLCYVNGAIATPLCLPVDAGAAMSTTDAAPSCKEVPVNDTRCLLCMTAAGGTSMPCLKCDAPVKTSDTGEYCRACGWTDLGGRCLQCFTADGTATLDDCDQLRAPSPPVDAGMPSKTGASG